MPVSVRFVSQWRLNGQTDSSGTTNKAFCLLWRFWKTINHFPLSPDLHLEALQSQLLLVFNQPRGNVLANIVYLLIQCLITKERSTSSHLATTWMIIPSGHIQGKVKSMYLATAELSQSHVSVRQFIWDDGRSGGKCIAVCIYYHHHNLLTFAVDIITTKSMIPEQRARFVSNQYFTMS